MKVKVKETGGKAKNWLERTLGFKGYLEYYWNASKHHTSLKPLPSIPYTIRINKTERFILREPNRFLFGKPVFTVMRGYPISIQTSLLQTTNPLVVGIIEDSNIDKTYIKKETDMMDIEITQFTKEQLAEFMKEFKKLKKGKIYKDYKNRVFSDAFNLHLAEKQAILDQMEVDKNKVNHVILEKRLIQEGESSFDFDANVQSGYTSVILRQKPMTTNLLLLIGAVIGLASAMTYIITSTFYNAQIQALGG